MVVGGLGESRISLKMYLHIRLIPVGRSLCIVPIESTLHSSISTQNRGDKGWGVRLRGHDAVVLAQGI